LSAGQIAYTSSNADPTITVQNTGSGAAAAFNNAGATTTLQFQQVQAMLLVYKAMQQYPAIQQPVHLTQDQQQYPAIQQPVH